MTPGNRYAAGYPIKLVRDEIGERLGGEGTITYEPTHDRDEHIALLRRKLVEEAAEFLASPSVGELADVYEVVRCLAEIDPACVSLDAVIGEANQKRTERGAFERGVLMVGHHAADGQDLLPRERAA